LLVAQVSAEDRKALDESIAALTDLLDKPMADREQMARAASRVSELAASLAQKLSAMKFTPALARALLRSISGDGDDIAHAGVRAAEQAYWSLESLYLAYSREEKGANDQAIKTAISKLVDYLEKPEQYNPAQFAALMQGVHRYFR
jgi:hypothetical protein